MEDMQSQTDVQPGTRDNLQPGTQTSQPQTMAEEETREEVKQQDDKAKSELGQLPQEIRDSLPEDAQRLFLAAYNGFYANSHDKEGALRVAWQTIEHNEHYARGADGKWSRLPEEDGGGHGALGTAPNS
ncbi:MAG TPA: ChaB family protein [Coleofasciculaceae cyanobacterium]